MKCLYLVCFFLLVTPALAQTRLSGTIKSREGHVLGNVTVRVVDTKIVDQSRENGNYSLSVPSHRIIVNFSKVGFQTVKLELDLSGKISYTQNVTLNPETKLLGEVNIVQRKDNITNTVLIDPAKSAFLPSVSGNFEAILKTLPGISANNELSSQYTVRGGNFDENLVYVNDIEIYRPFLVRNGQQEGLSFVNPELAGQIKFSAGGFEARYGDKMSSVLDVTYGRPDSSGITASAGILGYSATIKYLDKIGKSYFLAGLRQKFNQSVLKTQRTNGNYNPDFYDFQLLYNRQLNPKLSASYFGNFNLSKFQLIPSSSETEFGTLQNLLRLQVQYEGQEQDRYESWMNSVTFTYKPSDKAYVKWINSAFRISEKETFDIEGQYIFDELETDISSGEFGKVRANRGIGGSLAHARNHLQAEIYGSEIKAYLQKGLSYLESGFRYQFDRISDRLHEYSFIDSAGYTVPNNSGMSFLDVVSSRNRVSTSRVSLYVQDIVALSSAITLSAGVRGNYSSRNSEFLLTPRFSVAFQPHNTDLLYRFSAGVYSQPAFYREMRNVDGALINGSKAQKSVHFLAGMDKNLVKLNTPLKFTSEVYYKALSDLIPYKIENLRVRYLADQRARGYAAGADFSLSGEFVKDMESSFRLSLMKTMEDIEGDVYLKKNTDGTIEKIEPGFLKRPADQRINASVFFQDKLFRSPSNKVHLSFLYGSALPIGPPRRERYHDVFKIPAYKRADIGFSKDFLDSSLKRRPTNLQKYFSALILYAGVFNLLDNNNTVSYLWLKDVHDNQYAIPNYLTRRQLNLKLIAKIK